MFAPLDLAHGRVLHDRDAPGERLGDDAHALLHEMILDLIHRERELLRRGLSGRVAAHLDVREERREEAVL